MQYITRHDITDPDKVAAITASMERDGWVGSPIVTWGEYAITGTHRIAAADRAGIEIEAIDLEDLFAEAGLDFIAEWQAAGEPGALDQSELVDLLHALPVEMRAAYGLDIH